MNSSVEALRVTASEATRVAVSIDTTKSDEALIALFGEPEKKIVKKKGKK